MFSDPGLQIRELVEEKLKTSTNVGTVELVGPETISVRLAGNGGLIQEVRVVGGTASLAAGDIVYLLRFSDGNYLALSTSAPLATGAAPTSSGSHTHDGRYYTKSEMDVRLAGKSDVGHTHPPPDHIQAITGNIGGWVIAADRLTYDAVSSIPNPITGQFTPDRSAGMVPSDWPFYAGQTYANRATAPFRVNNQGQLWATQATISGNITASSGNIGGWTIGATALTAGSGANTVGLDTSGTNPAFYAGSSTPGSAPFRVTQAGALTATNATITGTVSSGNFSAGVSGWQIDNSGSAEFNDIRVRGSIQTAVLEYNRITATAGTMLVTRASGVLWANVVIPSSVTYGTTQVTVDVDAWEGYPTVQHFAANNFLRLKNGVSDTWLRVVSASQQTGFWRYTCTIEAGTANVTYRAGGAIVDYGAANSGGWIALSADGAVGHTPNISLATNGAMTQGVGGSLGATLFGRLGNIRGTLGITSDIYGLAFGDLSSNSTSFLRYDPVAGMQLRGNLILGPGAGGINLGDVAGLWRFEGPIRGDQTVHGTAVSHRGLAPTHFSSSSATSFPIYRRGRFGKAVAVKTSLHNRVPNPRFAINTSFWTTSQTTLTRVDAGENIVGRWAGRLTYAGSGDGFIASDPHNHGSALTNTTWTLTFKARLASSGAYTMHNPTSSVMIQANGGGWSSAATLNLTGLLTTNWQEFTITGTFGTESSTSVRVVFRPTATGPLLEISEVILTNSNYYTPYHDGDLPGCSWVGTAHQSSSLCAHTRLRYDASQILNLQQGSIGCWFRHTSHRPDWKRIFGIFVDQGGSTADPNSFNLLYNPSGLVYAAVGATPTNSNGTTPSAGWNHAVLTWNGTNARFYLNGSLIHSFSFGAFTATPNVLVIGGHYLDGFQLNDFIDEFFILEREMSASEVQALFTGNLPILTTFTGSDLILSEPGGGRVIGSGRGLFGYDSSSNEAFALVSGTGVQWGDLYTSLGPGSFILGDPDLGGHMFYDPSDRRLKFRGAASTTNQVEIGTDGRLYAGAGSILLGSEGARVLYTNQTSWQGDKGFALYNQNIAAITGGIFPYVAGGYYSMNIRAMTGSSGGAILNFYVEANYGSTPQIIWDFLADKNVYGGAYSTYVWNHQSWTMPIISPSGVRRIIPRNDTYSGANPDGGAEIVNDNATYNALMIVGANRGLGFGRWVRLWDTLSVHGPLRVEGYVFKQNSNNGLFQNGNYFNNGSVNYILQGGGYLTGVLIANARIDTGDSNGWFSITVTRNWFEDKVMGGSGTTIRLGMDNNGNVYVQRVAGTHGYRVSVLGIMTY